MIRKYGPILGSGYSGLASRRMKRLSLNVPAGALGKTIVCPFHTCPGSAVLAEYGTKPLGTVAVFISRRCSVKASVLVMLKLPSGALCAAPSEKSTPPQHWPIRFIVTPATPNDGALPLAW